MRAPMQFLKLGLLLAIPALAGCRSLDLVDAITPRHDYRAELDQPYGADPRQRLDIYHPLRAEDPNGPVVLFLYGGGWTDGAKADYRFVGESLAAAGYVTVVADYRLYPQTAFPGFVEDGAAAAGWMAAHLVKPDGTPRPIVLMGHSAGAYDAAMLATDGRYLDAPGGPGRHVIRAWIGLAGPYQFTPTGENTRILASPDGRPFMAADAADAGTPPALLVLAGDDEVVGQVNADKLEAKLKSLGVPVERKTEPGLSHAELVGALASSLTFLGPVRADVIRYLDAVPRG
jgi:acetyl esterase/lipase